MLKNFKELANDSVVYGLGSSIGQLISLFLVPFYSDALSPEEYGVLAIAGLFSQFTTPVFSLGLDNALFRYFSQAKTIEEERIWLTSASFFRIVAMLIFIVLIYFTYPLLNSYLFEGKLTYNIFCIVLASIFLSSIGALSEVVIRTQRKPKVLVSIQIVSMIISVALSVYLVLYLKWGVKGALLASLFGQAITATSLSVYIRKYIRFKSFSLSKSKVLMRYALPYVPHKVQGEIMQLFSLFIVNKYMGISVAGIYSVANKLVKPIYLITGSIQKAWVPYKFQLYKTVEDPRGIFRSLSGNYWFILIYMWCVASLFAPSVFMGLINERYHTGIKYFPFLAFIPISQAFYFTVNTGFELKKSQTILPIATFFGMLTVIGGSMLTVNYSAPYGPILSQSLAFLVIAFITYRYAHKILAIDFPFLLTFLFLILSLVIVFINYIFQVSVSTTILSVLCETGILLFILLRFNKTNPSAILEMLKRKI